MDGLTVQSHLAREHVDLERPDPKPRRPWPPPRAPEHGSDPGSQLRVTEGLYDVILAATLETPNPVQLAPAAGEVPTWSGPRLFLLLDDYDLIASSAGNQMPAIVEFLPQARDIGLHVVLARSAGGAGQGMYETVMRNLRDMGTPGILLSGSKDEGAVLGSQKMEPLPPGRGRLVHRRLGSVLVQTARAVDA